MIGFTGGWIAFLGAVTVGPIMVEAMLLYTSNYISSLTTVSGSRPVLTVQGYFVAGTLLLLFCKINVMGVRWLADINMLAVCWKHQRSFAHRCGSRSDRDQPEPPGFRARDTPAAPDLLLAAREIGRAHV